MSKLPPPYYHLPSTHRLSVYEAPAHAHLLSPASYILHPPPRAHEAGLVSSLSENSHLPPASWRVTVTVTPPTRLVRSLSHILHCSPALALPTTSLW